MSKRAKYITKNGAERLRSEYHELHSVERPKMVETVAWAASNGDRSENADYQYGKRRLREIDRRLYFISDFLESANVVDPTEVTSEKIVFGASVLVEDENGVEKSFRIVGEVEMDVTKGDISYLSPVGKALLGASIDDTVVVRTPKGEKEFTVLKIQYKE